MDVALLSILALGILIVCIISYPDKFIPKSIENMNTEEIITDFELLIQSENEKAKLGEPFSNKPLGQTEFNKGVGWGMYTQAPLYELKTHPREPVFYNKPLYRLPYRFPETYISTYPVLHNSVYKN
jgi:hypothetical protein